MVMRRRQCLTILAIAIAARIVFLSPSSSLAIGGGDAAEHSCDAHVNSRLYKVLWPGNVAVIKYLPIRSFIEKQSAPSMVGEVRNFSLVFTYCDKGGGDGKSIGRMRFHVDN